MKQLLILSGKGGTGKTTVAAAFIKLSQAKACADCDVDAPNLHFTLNKDIPSEQTPFYGLNIAHIDQKQCAQCALCLRHCRFGAIVCKDGAYAVDTPACEGCGVCEAICPKKAVSLVPDPAGAMMLYSDEKFVFSTARLKMGKGNSGMLVTEVKKRMRDSAPPETSVAVIDGSPGIGCPVIASLSGVDMVLIVAEPSLSGMSDMERIIKTAGKFGVGMAVCVNKYDMSEANTRAIEAFCKGNDIPFMGKIPFDPQVVKTVNSGRSIIDVDCPSGKAVHLIYNTVISLLGKRETLT